MQKRQVVVGTRFFEKDPANVVRSVEKLEQFALSALRLSHPTKVLVAVNTDEDQSEVLQNSAFRQGELGRYFQDGKVVLFPVTPWGTFVSAMNALLVKGRQQFAAGHLFLSASVEVELTDAIVHVLTQHMDDQTLVVGAAMEGHYYRPGIVEYPANGRQVPWNTLALWNPAFLCRTGFSDDR